MLLTTLFKFKLYLSLNETKTVSNNHIRKSSLPTNNYKSKQIKYKNNTIQTTKYQKVINQQFSKLIKGSTYPTEDILLSPHGTGDKIHEPLNSQVEFTTNVNHDLSYKITFNYIKFAFADKTLKKLVFPILLLQIILG